MTLDLRWHFAIWRGSGGEGEQAGAVGINRIERADGRVEALLATATASVDVTAGYVVVIETPGGGAYGARG